MTLKWNPDLSPPRYILVITATFLRPPSKNDHTFSCKETFVNTVTSLLQPNFFGPLVVVLTGFHCICLRSQWIESLRDKDCWIFVHTIWLHPPFFSIQLPQCGHCIKKTTAIHENDDSAGHTVQATGIAALTRGYIACNMADFHEKSTQKTRV